VSRYAPDPRLLVIADWYESNTEEGGDEVIPGAVYRACFTLDDLRGLRQNDPRNWQCSVHPWQSVQTVATAADTTLRGRSGAVHVHNLCADWLREFENIEYLEVCDQCEFYINEREIVDETYDTIAFVNGRAAVQRWNERGYDIFAGWRYDPDPAQPRSSEWSASRCDCCNLYADGSRTKAMAIPRS
jgi:hypothetical protein